MTTSCFNAEKIAYSSAPHSQPPLEYIKSIPRPEKTSEADFGPAAQELFDRIMQTADNAGGTDEYWAVNYLAVRYPAIYATAADRYGGCSNKGTKTPRDLA